MSEKENQQYKWRQRKKRNSYIAVWIVLVILLSVLGTFVFKGMQTSDPLKVAKKYIEDNIGVSEYTVETGDRSLNDQNQFVQEYTFTYTADGKETTRKLNMVEQEKKKYGVFDQWGTGSAASADTMDFDLIAPADSQVLVNGVAPTADEIKEDDTLSPAVVCYQLTGVDAKDCKVQVNGLPFDSYQVDVQKGVSVVDVRDGLVVGENAQTQMTELGKKMINELYAAAFENKKADQLSELFDKAPNKANLYKQIVKNLYDGDELKIDSITFKEFKPTFGEVYYPGKDEDPYIGMEMKLAYTVEYEVASEEETESTEAVEEGTEETPATEANTQKKKAAKVATLNFRYEKGECIVTSIEVPNAIS